jgi:hypothetical protein
MYDECNFLLEVSTVYELEVQWCWMVVPALTHTERVGELSKIEMEFIA